MSYRPESTDPEAITEPQRKRPQLLCALCLKEPRTVECWGGVWLGQECGLSWISQPIWKDPKCRADPEGTFKAWFTEMKGRAA
jgi:hypothetical protein